MNILKLPISISNFIVISDSLNQTRDRRLFIKMFNDYMEFLPIQLCSVCSTDHID